MLQVLTAVLFQSVQPSEPPTLPNPPQPLAPPPTVLEVRPIVLEICGLADNLPQSFTQPTSGTLNHVAEPIRSHDVQNELRIIQAELADSILGVSHDHLQINELERTVR